MYVCFPGWTCGLRWRHVKIHEKLQLAFLYFGGDADCGLGGLEKGGETLLKLKYLRIAWPRMINLRLKTFKSRTSYISKIKGFGLFKKKNAELVKDSMANSLDNT